MVFTKEEKKYAFWNSFIFIFIQIVNFVNYTLNLKTYGFELLGGFLLVGAIYGIGASVDFGFGISTIKHLSEARKKTDISLVNSIYITFLILFLILAIIIVCSYVLYYFIFFKNSELVLNDNSNNLRIIYFLLLITFFFNYIANYFKAVCEGFLKFVSLGKILLIISLFNLILMLIIFILKLELIYLAYFNLLGSFILCFILFIFTAYHLEGIQFNIRFFDLGLIKKYYSYNLNLQLTFFISSFLDLIIKFCLGKYLSLSYVTFFESVKKIINFSIGLIQSAQKGVLNKLSEEMAIDNIKKYIDEDLFFYSKMANYYSIIIYGVTNPILCYFILIWFNSIETMIIFLILLLPYLLINFIAPPYCVLMIEGKGFKLPFLQIINISLTAVFLIISIKLFNNYLGILGYYIAIIINIYLVFYFLKFGYDMNYRKFLIQTKFNDIIKLSLLILTQFLLLFYFQQYINYILFIYLTIYLLVFRKYVIYILKKFYSQIKFFKLNYLFKG